MSPFPRFSVVFRYSDKNSVKILATFSAFSMVSISQNTRSSGSVPEKRAMTQPPFLKYTLQPSM